MQLEVQTFADSRVCIVEISFASVLLSKIPGLVEGGHLIGLPVLGGLVVQRVVGVGRGQQTLNRQKHRSYLQGRRPVLLQDVEADSAQVVDVGVIDLGVEDNLGWAHRVVLGQQQLGVKLASFIAGLLRA
jgi:hypothetical protein